MIRLRTLLARQLHISGSDADLLIGLGHVRVDGKILPPSTRIQPHQQIQLDGNILREGVSHTYILFNKPSGIECTLNTRIANHLLTVFQYPKRLVPVGRLDKDSEGLLLLTDDGWVTKKITWNKNNYEKEYLVSVDGPVTELFLARLREGVSILGKMTLPTIVHEESGTLNTFRIILTEGRNRQIRRMCYKLGYTVTRLIRKRIIHLELGVLSPGEWRELTLEEVQHLHNIILVQA
jgi:23S rRNA pseudouridine2604 synthase